MSVEVAAIVMVLSFVTCLIAGIPIAISLIAVSLIFGLILIGPQALYMAGMAVVGTATVDIYLAIPLFVFMGVVLQFSGIVRDLYEVMYNWAGPLRGGLAIGTVGASTVLSAMVGTGSPGVVTMGLIALPEMLRRKYDRPLAMGTIVAGATLGPLIPPSILLIIIGGFANVSVGQLLIGGIIPGLIISALFSLYIGMACWRRPEMGPALPPADRASWRKKIVLLRGVILPILLIVGVLGGIYTGACTPTEASAVGAIGAMICAAVKGQLNLTNLKQATRTTVTVAVMVYFLLIGGTLYSQVLTGSGIGFYISDLLVGAAVTPTVGLIIMMVIPFIMGMFMDGAAITMICIPIFMPVVYSLGLHPIWFCMLFNINLLIGYLTPPFGINLFYMKGVAPSGVTMGELYRSVIPFIPVMIVGLVLCILFPEVVLLLPRLMLK